MVDSGPRAGDIGRCEADSDKAVETVPIYAFSDLNFLRYNDPEHVVVVLGCLSDYRDRDLCVFDIDSGEIYVVGRDTFNRVPFK